MKQFNGLSCCDVDLLCTSWSRAKPSVERSLMRSLNTPEQRRRSGLLLSVKQRRLALCRRPWRARVSGKNTTFTSTFFVTFMFYREKPRQRFLRWTARLCAVCRRPWRNVQCACFRLRPPSHVICSTAFPCTLRYKRSFGQFCWHSELLPAEAWTYFSELPNREHVVILVRITEGLNDVELHPASLRIIAVTFNPPGCSCARSMCLQVPAELVALTVGTWDDRQLPNKQDAFKTRRSGLVRWNVWVWWFILAVLTWVTSATSWSMSA